MSASPTLEPGRGEKFLPREYGEATSLMRMFGPNGNPSVKNLFGVLAHLQAQEGVNFEIRPRRSSLT